MQDRHAHNRQCNHCTTRRPWLPRTASTWAHSIDACSVQDERRQTCTSQKQQNNTSVDYDQIKFFIYGGNRYACMLVYIHQALVQTRERGTESERACKKGNFRCKGSDLPQNAPFSCTNWCFPLTPLSPQPPLTSESSI